MQFEIDYLGVGNGENSGDAIGIRFGNLSAKDPAQQHIVIIDGGYKESGEELVQHIKDLYGTNYVDLMISTHPDGDHIAGLAVVIQRLTVQTLLMHKPWTRPVSNDLNKEVAAAKKSCAQAVDLEDLAARKGVTIAEPFAGGSIQFTDQAQMIILGPDEDYYTGLLGGFEHNKDFEEIIKHAFERSISGTAAILKSIKESLDPTSETLDHVHKNTSNENNSSTVLYFNIAGHGLLFTGDAGIEALHRAADYAANLGLDLTNLRFLDVPHHGSKHNVDTALLDRVNAQTAYISAAAASKKHPSPRVVNALLRRGMNVFTTQNGGIRHNFNSPARPNWSPIQPLTFVEEFEDED